MDEQTRRQRWKELEDRTFEQAGETHPESGEPAVRWLTSEELDELRRDMKEASAWARAELKRRKADR
ncbi:MAG: hypothetical protein CL809_10985 [Cobetia sp.]|jgi:hypothetical protein|uniref:hypothetical protein n=1 Tax=Cobetia sp. TaxID=1873876 RepID=UPI000C6AE530|nr:hypothetical protein [Cobetia sp.]MBF09402.1 hypothetical protein [Cobetia sp.]|tara:strand:- start:22331 stop:22531 length:201 start_codon:yes stop_codon:yes gene_type:complete